MLAVRTVLCPIDYSDRDAAALDLAAAIARDYRAELVIAHVETPIVPVAVEGVLLSVPPATPAESRQRLDAVTVGVPPVRVTRELAVGEAADEIVRLADRHKADLIVMGTHGRSGLSRWLAGSVAESVLRAAPCPVLTVRPPPVA